MDLLSKVFDLLDSKYGNCVISENSDKNGYIITCGADYGGYEIVVPKNCENPNIYLYMHGSDGFGGDKIALENHLNNENSNSIIIAPTGSVTYTKQLCDDILSVGKEISEIFNSNADLRSIGFSAGANASIKTTIQYIDNNPHCGRQISLLIDPVYGIDIGDGIFTHLNASEIDTLNENGTLFVTYTQSQHIYTNCRYKNVIKSGLNILFISSVPEHGYQRDNVFGDNGIAFAGGNTVSLLNDGKYSYSYYDMQNNEWITLTSDEAYQIINMIPSDKTKFFYTNHLRALKIMDDSDYKVTRDYRFKDNIKVNFEFVKRNVNDIIKVINSYFSNEKKNIGGYASSTKNPSRYSEIINKCSLDSLIILNKMAASINQVQNVANDIKNLDIKMADEAEKVGE